MLEASAARIERLERLLLMSELANRMSEVQTQRVSEELNAVLEREHRGMQWLDGCRTLRGAGNLDSRFACTLLDCQTGQLLDANAAFFNITRFTPGGVLQRKLDGVPQEPDGQQLRHHNGKATLEFPLVRAKRESDDGCSGASGLTRWVPLQPVRQYPRTMRLLEEMVKGQVDQFHAPYRCRWLDGQPHPSPHVSHSTSEHSCTASALSHAFMVWLCCYCCSGYAYEIQAFVWVADVEWVEEADGSRWKRPLNFGCAASIDDTCRVDEE